MPKAKKIPMKTDAAIVAMLLSGTFNSQQQIADEMGVSKAHVTKVKKSIPKDLLDQLNEVKADKFADLVSQNLEAMLDSNIRIANLTNNELWMEKQTAAEIATLLGVQSDKVFRILAAIEAANKEADEE